MESDITISRQDANMIIAYLTSLKNKTEDEVIRIDIEERIERLKLKGNNNGTE